MQLWGKSEQIAGFLDRGIHITGELQFTGILRIDGHFHGSISSSDSLIVGEHAVVHADIHVGDLEVHGQIYGNVLADGRTEIFPTGRLHGDLRTKTIVVQSGGVLDGHCQMSVADGSSQESNSATRATDSDEKQTVDLSPQN
jgi:cytoskeletal protein CcmA (bactofilin family)